MNTTRPRKRFPNRAWLASFFLVLSLLFANGVISYHAVQALISNEEKVSETLNTLNIIKDTFSVIQDAEIGERGYLISADESDLETYRSATRKINTYLIQLLQLDSDIETQRPRIYSLTQLVQEKLIEMEKTIELREEYQLNIQQNPNSQDDLNNQKNVVQLFVAEKNNGLMMRIRELVGELQQAEYDKLNQQRREANRVQQQVILTLMFATAIGLILTGVVYVLVGRALQKQRNDAEKLALTNEELESIVAQRTTALERYAVELQRSNRELQDFAFVASHDLQEPLRKIRSFGDLLERKYAPELGEGSDYIRRMQAAATRMSSLIEDLLTFSRISSEVKKFELVSLQDVLQEVLEDLDVTIEATDAKMDVNPLPKIEADPTQMRQLLQNLIGNAIKFVPACRKPAIRIESHCFIPSSDKEQGWVEIQVIDNGIGFENQFTDRIFTPFQRLHEINKYPGTGMGLSICRRIVEHHHGSIKAHSRPNEGATFIVRLPLRQDSAAQLYTNTGTHHETIHTSIDRVNG